MTFAPGAPETLAPPLIFPQPKVYLGSEKSAKTGVTAEAEQIARQKNYYKFGKLCSAFMLFLHSEVVDFLPYVLQFVITITRCYSVQLCIFGKYSKFRIKTNICLNKN